MEEKELQYEKADNGKYGYVDGKGNWVIEPKFDDAWRFIGEFAKVELDGKYGFIKTDGTYLVEPQLDEAGAFNEGIAKVKLDGKWGIVKADGTYLAEPIYNEIVGDLRDSGIILYSKDKIKILQSGGVLKEGKRIDYYIASCQKLGPASFLEASKDSCDWKFVSWERRTGFDDEFYDELSKDEEFANWANSLNLSSQEEVGELLWVHAQVLTDMIKENQKPWDYDEEATLLKFMIQLYWQLKNIYDLGLQNIRKGLGLPEEEELYLNPELLSAYGKKFYKELEWGFHMSNAESFPFK